MNTRSLIAATLVALTAASGAMAQEATIDPVVSFSNSTVTRAQTLALAKTALANGELHEVAQINAGGAFAGTLTRDAVRHATLLAKASGEAALIDAEAYPFNGGPGLRDASHFRVAALSR